MVIIIITVNNNNNNYSIADLVISFIKEESLRLLLNMERVLAPWIEDCATGNELTLTLTFLEARRRFF